MRIPIREQLAAIIVLASLVSLAVISIATWITNHNFVIDVRTSQLSLTATLKAAQIASAINLYQTTANFVSTRVLIQRALMRYNEGNNTQDNWESAQVDLNAALGGGASLGQTLLLQAVVHPVNNTGLNGPYAVLNSTGKNSEIRLPYTSDDGAVFLGDDGLGYPPPLYPNLTYTTRPYNSTFDMPVAEFAGVTLDPMSGTMLVGPWSVNSTFSMVSLTMPIINNTSAVDVLGWLTVVMDARLIQAVLNSSDGLDKTGQTLLIGPVNAANRFPNGFPYLRPGNPSPPFPVHFVVPLNTTENSRHPRHVVGSANAPLNASQYPAIKQAITETNSGATNAGAFISSRNEANKKVSVGFAIPQTDVVDWVVLVEQARGEVWRPIDHLRNILIACVIATAVFMVIIAYPLAHFGSAPIRRLREATAKSVEPPNSLPSRTSLGSFDSYEQNDGPNDDSGSGDAAAAALAKKEGFHNPITNWRQKRNAQIEARREERRRRAFRIPGKVRERKHLVKDELTDLTFTFNEMSDELMMQYEKLEERVQQRTQELELSKKAAEAANESKTLFIANISHELKTPLNGILGMCAVCMQEDDPIRLKRSLGIIYKSGDLLLNLLTDLLTFSKNQVGQHLSLDEKEFRLRDISSQVLAIFDKQAKEGQIDLRVEWEGVEHGMGHNESTSPERKATGPLGMGRIKDMILWGDTHRILQVVINLVSNSLKFTPAGGSVVLTIRCLPEIPDVGSRKGSVQSRQSRGQRSSRHKTSDATLPMPAATANQITPVDRTFYHAMAQERAASPPPGKYLYFEFEVQDTGPGIPDNLQQRIFEPFVQGDLGLSKKFGGTGLGLSICSQLAALMRGTIGVRSVVNLGSTFTMKIPLRHLQSRADSTASSTLDLHHANSSASDSDGNVRRSASLRSDAANSGLHTPARHSRHYPSDTNPPSPSPSTPPPPVQTPTTPAIDAQPRLVGLSQPFFASSQPLESPNSQPAAMRATSAAATRAVGNQKIRVLVAEDNKVNQEVVLRMLKLEDIYDVTVAKDGQEALDLVKLSMMPQGLGEEEFGADGKRHEPYNLIFMDVQMPNVDGLQSTRLIREIGYQAPIVALTAFAEESNIRDCLESGMNYFLSKPIRRPQLKKVLKEYCAPIPEEEGEDPTPPSAAAASASTTAATATATANNAKTTKPTAKRRSSSSKDRDRDRDRENEANKAAAASLASRGDAIVVVSANGGAVADGVGSRGEGGGGVGSGGVEGRGRGRGRGMGGLGDGVDGAGAGAGAGGGDGDADADADADRRPISPVSSSRLLGEESAEPVSPFTTT